MHNSIEFQSINMALGELYALLNENQLFVPNPKNPWNKNKTLIKSESFLHKSPFEGKALLVLSNPTTGRWDVVSHKNKLLTLFYMIEKKLYPDELISIKRTRIKVHVVNLFHKHKPIPQAFGVKSIKKACSIISSGLD